MIVGKPAMLRLGEAAAEQGAEIDVRSVIDSVAGGATGPAINRQALIVVGRSMKYREFEYNVAHPSVRLDHLDRHSLP